MKETIPKGWAIAKLGELIEYVIGGDWGKDSEFPDNDYVSVLCIRGSEFKYWKENKGNTASIRKIKKASLVSRKLEIDDILLEISGGGPDQPVGRTVIIDKSVLSFKPELPKVCTNFLRLLRINKEIDAVYLNYYLKLFYSSGQIVNYQGGSNNLRNLKFNDFITINIPIAPLPEQHRILAKLEQLLTDLDKGIEYLTTAQQQLKVYRQAVLKWAFEGKLTNTTQIVWKKLGDYLDFVGSGVTPKGGQEVYQKSGVIFIRSQNVYPNKFELNDVAFISDEIDERMKRTRVYPDDVLLNITGASIGRCTYVPKNFASANVNQHVCILRAKQTILNCVFLSSYLNSSKAQTEIMNTQSGATRQGLNFQQVRNLEVPICSAKEQKKILQEIESRLSVCDKIEETIAGSLQQAEALRLSIIKKAFKGKLVPQDPNDEPAEKLLERIRAEKKAAEQRNVYRKNTKSNPSSVGAK